MQIGGLEVDGGGKPTGGCSKPSLPPAEGPVSQQLQALLDFDFAWQLSDNPEFASQAGFHEHDGELQELGPQSWDVRMDHNSTLLARLEALDLTSAEVLDAQRLHGKLLETALRDETRAIELGCHLMALNSTGSGSVHESFLELIEWMSFESEDDFRTYLSRLMAFPVQVQGFQDSLAYGAGMRGITVSKSMMRKVQERLRELIDSDLPALKAPLEAKGPELDPELVQQIHDAIENCFKGSLRGLLDFLEEFYAGRVRDEPGCKALRAGAEVYAQCLRFHTTTAKSAQEIHDVGLKEVARIEARIQSEVLDRLGFQGSLVDFAEKLRKDASQYYSSEDELLDGYRALVPRLQQSLPQFFSKLPEKLEVVKKEGMANRTSDGRIYIDASRVDMQPKYKMPASVLRQSLQAHQLRIAADLPKEELPNFLRYIERRRYEFCPARRPLYEAYVDGWAAYCESLGEQMGIYSTPEELFGHLASEMCRGVGLVVDTGIHEFGWTLEQAATYLRENTDMTAAECEAECHRYAAWPGRAVACKVGQLAIREMQHKAKAELGQAFNLQAFHEAALGAGPLPLDILDQCLQKWAEAQKRSAA